MVQGYPKRIGLYKNDRKLSAWEMIIYLPMKWFGKETNKFSVAGKREYCETNSKHSEKSHPLWVTLYNR